MAANRELKLKAQDLKPTASDLGHCQIAVVGPGYRRIGGSSAEQDLQICCSG